jgi:hypothetical protein
MNCTSARNRLLTQPDPALVPDAVAGHLAACPGCQGWHRLLLQVEMAVAAAAVPGTDGRARRRLVELFRTGRTGKSDSGRLRVGKPAQAARGVVVPAARTPMGDRLARLWPAGLVAAALLVGTVTWIVLSGKPDDTGTVAHLPPDPMLAKVVAAKVKIDTAESPAARLAAWSDLANDIHDQAKTLAKVTPDDMDSLAGLYEQVVGNDALIGQARLLDEGERKTMLAKLAGQLAETEQEANRMKTEVPPRSERPLQRIADAAKASKEKLNQPQQGRAL